MPVVSAIIPTQRRPAMLRNAAQSVLVQTFRDVELIIALNDASSEARDAANEIAATDPRVRVIEIKRGNLAAARNAGISVARGNWIALLDDDDEWLPTKTEVQLAEALASNADLVTCDMVQFDESGDIGPVGTAIPAHLTLNEALTIYNCLPGSAAGAFMRASALRELGGFDERMRACEDWDMWRRFGWRHKITRVHKVLARYRIHNASMSRNRYLILRSELWHLTKMVFDTPPEFRHMVPRAWAAMFWREAANVYAWLNIKSGGRVQPAWRTIRSMVKS